MAMTMQQVADRIGLSVSTVSRAVKDKCILFRGRSIPVRSLFTNNVSAVGGTVSSALAKNELKRLIRAEDPCHPLSDTALCEALSGLGILLSRRTVAKYRDQLSIPPAHVRRKYER